MSRAGALAAAVAGALLALPSCGGDPVHRAHDRALHYFASQVEGADPSWANLFGYMNRRFGLEVDNAAGLPLHRVPEDPRRPEMAALYRRLSDRSASVPPALIAKLPSVIDRMTASALHCDRIPLPPNYADVLAQASEAGGYALTHATLAGEWALENGCLEYAALAPVQHRQVEQLAALVEDREALAARFDAPTDLWIEALAMLYYVRAGSRVEPAWIEALLAAQRPDGGWPRHPDADTSDPHPSALALWVLLENLRPEAPPIRWIP